MRHGPLRLPVPLCRDGRRVQVEDARLSAPADQRVEGRENLLAAESGHHERYPVFSGKRLEGAAPRNHADVARRQKAVDSALVFADPVDDRRHGLQRGQQAQVPDIRLLGLFEKHGVDRRRRLESHGGEHKPAGFRGRRDAQRIHRRIHHADPAPGRAGVVQAPAAAPHAQQVAEREHRRARLQAQLHQAVDVRGHRDADRAPGPGNQPDGRRKHPRDAAARNLRRMGAADLHQAERRPAVVFQVGPDIRHSASSSFRISRISLPSFFVSTCRMQPA